MAVKFHRSHKKANNKLQHQKHERSLFSKLKLESLHSQKTKVGQQKIKLAAMRSFRFKESITLGSTSGAMVSGMIQRGWLKFLEWNGMGDMQLHFYENPEFAEQSKRPFDEEAEDDYGAISIPAKDMFYFLLGEQGIFALTSRRNQLDKTQKYLHMSDIKPISKSIKTGAFTGGLEDLGNFREGFCWKIITQDDAMWIQCSLSLAAKEEWMSAIEHVKGTVTKFAQADAQLEGTAEMPDENNALKSPPNYDQVGPDGEAIISSYGAPIRMVDSQWKPLADWSTCTLQCGGGTQTLQQVCILGTGPEAKPCQGSAIITKPCNQSPCEPEPGAVPDSDAPSESENRPMQVKMMRVSYRPSRYETCIIKEGDMDMIRTDMYKFQRPPRVPTRVILNNMTLSVFQTTEYDTVLFSAELASIMLKKYEGDDACFVAVDPATGASVTLCSLSTIIGQTMQANRNEWVKQIGFFRDNCHQKLRQIDADLEIADIKRGEVEMEEEEANAGGSSAVDNTSELGAVSGLAVDALAKESKYERLAEKEELDREVMEELESRKAIERQKAADECLARDERKAAQIMKEQMALQEAQEEVVDMKGNIKNMVMSQRAASSKKIAMMKKLADKNKRASQDQLRGMRTSMAMKAAEALRNGDALKCDPKQSSADKAKYCNMEFDTDPELNKDCKSEDFCMMCCQQEFGNKFAAARANCQSQCDGGKTQGNWVWVPEANAVKV